LFLKKLTLLFVAMAIAAAVAIPAFADDYMDAVDQYKGRVDKYFESVKVYENSVDNKSRAADNLIADQQMQQQSAPPAGQFWPEPEQSQPAVVPVPVPTPTWGLSCYRYWDATLLDWIFAPIWCPVGWTPPYGWYSVNYVDRYQFRHFSRGWVRGGRLSYDRSVDLHPHGVFHGNRGGAVGVTKASQDFYRKPQQQFQPRQQSQARPPQNFQQRQQQMTRPQQFARPQFQQQPRPQYRPAPQPRPQFQRPPQQYNAAQGGRH
jgi:hypothetical protein